MTLLSHFSQNFFNSIFGKKKIEATKEEGVIKDENSEPIPSFSVLNQSNTSDNDYLQPSYINKRTNIFFDNDIQSNDTNEIINYNLKKLSSHQDDVITTCVDASGELIKYDNDHNTKIYSSPSINATLTNVQTNSSINSNIDSEKNLDSDLKADLKFNFESNSYSDTNDESEKSTLYFSTSLQQKQQQQQQQQEKNKLQSKINLINDVIPEDSDRISNMPPPFIKINNRNLDLVDTIPLKSCRNSTSVPTNFTSMNNYSLANRTNILSHSLEATKGISKAIPGIKTIELKKVDPNKLSVTAIPSTKRCASLSSSFSPKELSAPISSSLLAIQNEQPSFASLINDETDTKEEISDLELPYYPFNEEDEDDIFSYDL